MPPAATGRAMLTAVAKVAAAIAFHAAATTATTRGSGSGSSLIAAALPGYAQQKRKPPPPPPEGIHFFAGFSDHAVLQRQPSRAVLYGVLGAGGTGATVQISRAEVGAGEILPAPVEVVAATLGGDGEWKALLPAHPAGGCADERRSDRRAPPC